MEQGIQWDLPLDIIKLILAHLSPIQIAKCACVASHWRAAIRKSDLQRQLDLESSWRQGEAKLTKLEATFFETMCVSKRGNLIAMGSTGRTRIWDLTKGEVIRVLDTSGRSCSMCLLEDVVLSGDQGGNVDVWDVERGIRMSKFVAHMGMVGCIAEVGTEVVTGGDDRVLRIWNPETWECLHVLLGVISHHVRAMVPVDNGNTLLIGTIHGGIQVLDVATRECIREFGGNTPGVLSLSIHKDWVVCGTFGTIANLSNFRKGELMQEYMSSVTWVQCVDLDGDRLVLGGSSPTLDVWDIAQHKIVRSVPANNTPIGVWLRNSQLVVANRKGNIEIWDFLP